MKYKNISVNKQLSSYLLNLKESWRIVILLSLFVCGLIIGSFVVKNNDSFLSSELKGIIESAVIKKSNSDFLKIFAQSFASDFLFLFLSFACGLCAIGIPAIGPLPLLKGFSMGISGAYIYSNYSVKGVCYCLLILFPAQIISTAILIYACNESFYMSEDLFLTLNNGAVKEKNLIRLYLTRFSLLALFTVLTALFDAVLNQLFSGLIGLV